MDDGTPKKRKYRHNNEFQTNEDDDTEPRREIPQVVLPPYSNKRNKTLSLSGPIHIKKIDGKTEKSWARNGGANSKEERSVRIYGNSDVENQISSIEKEEEESGLASARDAQL